MIRQLDSSERNVLGFAVSGDISKDDYKLLTPAVSSAIGQYGNVNILLDMTEFKWEKVNAWGADLSFGHELHGSIAKMAIVGNKTWEKHLTKLATPLYAKDAQYFETLDDGWTWVKDQTDSS